MNTRIKLWLLPTLFYAIFVFWYTDFGGPLNDEEIDEFVQVMTDNGVGHVQAFLDVNSTVNI